jgi:hypothetical protein
MRILDMRFFSVLIAATVLASSLAVTESKSRADQFPNITMLHCSHFAATMWTLQNRRNPAADKTGNQYGMALFNGKITGKIGCAQAIAWATKLMRQHTSNGVFMPTEVRGGPAGYRCFLTPDGSGHWLGGTCQIRDSSGAPLTSFDWLAATD